MRVLFLTQYPKLAPSPRYRVYQLVEWLEANDVECDCQPLIDEAAYLKSRKQGNLLWKAWTLANAFRKRWSVAKRAGDYDLVYVLKGAFMYGPPAIERRIRKTGTPMIFDYDDAIFIHKASTHNGIMDWFRSTNRIPETIKMVDRVVVPNQFLADYSRKFNPNVTIVAEAEDTDRFTMRPPHSIAASKQGTTTDPPVVIGWIGSPSTVKYVRLIEGALREICRRYPQVVFRTVGGEFHADGIRVENVQWTLEQEVENFHGLDVGIMPLPLEEWSKGKSGCKLRQYMASGVPGVATRIGYNCELVDDGKNGLLVETEQEWITALEKLIVDPALRNQMARQARESVVERFSIPVIGPRLIEAFQATLQQSAPATA